jgi:hypothetical protein
MKESIELHEKLYMAQPESFVMVRKELNECRLKNPL